MLQLHLGSIWHAACLSCSLNPEAGYLLRIFRKHFFFFLPTKTCIPHLEYKFMEMGGADSFARKQAVVILIIISLWNAAVTLK